MALPVVLVHGITDQGDSFDPVRHYLEGDRQLHAPDLAQADGSVGLEALAQDLASQLERLQATGSFLRFDLVAHSLGGLVSRYYLQRLGGERHVRRLVTIATPHRGTFTAYGLQGPLGRELRPGSELLRGLNADWPNFARTLAVTSIWTPFDLIVSPGWHGIAPHGQAVRVNASRHARILGHPATWAAVRAALSPERS